MKKIIITLVGITLLSSFGYSKELVNKAGKSGISLSGYDPVAFHTDKKAINGDPGIQSKHRGAVYLFYNKENKAMFEKNPDKYAPSYGGYCAFGVSVGAFFPIDMSTATIRDGKLFFCLNKTLLDLYLKDYNENKAKADKNWIKLFNEHAE